MDHSSPFKIIGVKFKTGAPYSLNLMNAPTISVNNIEAVDLNSLFTDASFETDALFDKALDQKQLACRQLDDIFSTLLVTSNDDKHSELVRQILPLLNDITIAEIGGSLHRSQRTVERSFIKVTGLSMKQVRSMNRLEELLNYVYKLKDSDINWADIASKYGFSDQPHLIRHLKQAIGLTPALYAKERNLTIDIYGDFEFN